MQNVSFSPWPSYTHEEAEAISKVLLSNKVNYWTGTECRDFESEFAVWTESEYAIALANGTVALDIILKSLDLKEQDEVIVTSRTFLASASSIITAGARPVFADVDPDSQNITVESISSVLTKHTKAIICVHLAGWPCDMDSIMALAKKHGLYVIEDCAQAHGSLYKGKPVGSLGHAGAWSFCQDKIMTTGGEGGMVTTNDRDLWLKMWSYKDHGKSWHSTHEKNHPVGFRWLHDSFGSNLRMTEMQAVIGRIQLKRMNKWHQLRSQNATKILEAAKQFPNVLRAPQPPENLEHAWYKCYLFVRPEGLAPGWNRDRIMDEINLLGVPCFTGTCPEVYLEKAFEDTEFKPKERLPVAKNLGETSLMFLVHPTLTEAEIAKTVDVIQYVMAQASTTSLRA